MVVSRGGSRLETEGRDRDVKGKWGPVPRAYLSLNAQNCWLIICQTISSDAMAAVVQESTGRSIQWRRRR